MHVLLLFSAQRWLQISFFHCDWNIAMDLCDGRSRCSCHASTMQVDTSPR